MVFPHILMSDMVLVLVIANPLLDHLLHRGYMKLISELLMLINKSKPQNLKNKVIIIDASKEYKEGKNQNTLSIENIEKTVKAFENLEDVEKFMRVVDISEIKENDYNLNIARYIDASEEEEIIDIKSVIEKIAQTEQKEKAIDEKLNGYLKTLGFEI